MEVWTNTWITDSEDVEVRVYPASNGRVGMTIGMIASFYMDEPMLDRFTENLLKAKFEYIQKGGGKHEGESSK